VIAQAQDNDPCTMLRLFPGLPERDSPIQFDFSVRTMINSDHTHEQYWADTQGAPGYKQCALSCQSGSGERRMSGGDLKIPAFDADRTVQFGVTSAAGLAWQRKQANAGYAHRASESSSPYSCVVITRRWGLGILSLGPLAPAGH
jgi:hypothetical protein